MAAPNPVFFLYLWRRAGCLALSALFVATLLPAQILADQADAGWSVRGWSSGTGLPVDEDYDLVQGGDGFLWIATSQGVFRFDGGRFTAVPVSELSHEYNSNCYVLCAARDGSVWWALDHGRVVCWRQGQTSVWQVAQGMPNDTPTSICESRDGAVFIGFRKSGVAEIAHGKVKLFSSDDGIPTGSRCFLAADGEGNVWCGAGNALEEFRDGGFVRIADIPGDSANALSPARKGGVWVQDHHNNLRRFLPSGVIDQTVQVPASLGYLTAFYEDGGGNLWVGTSNSPGSGLFRLENGQFLAAGVERRQISSITGDREGNIWLTTLDDGIKQLRPRLIRFLNVDSGLPDWGRVSSFTVDAAGGIWVVLEDKSVLHLKDGKWKEAPGSSERGNALGWAVSVEGAPDGSVLVATRDNGVFRYASGQDEVAAVPVSGRIPHVMATLCSHAGDLWVAANHALLTRIRADGTDQWTNPDGATAHLLAEGTNGNILMAASGGRAGEGRLYEASGGGITELPFPGSGEFPIHGLCCDRDGNTWIGFVGGGLGRLKDGRFTRVTTKDGLADDYIYQVLPDGLGRIWIISNTGLSRIDVADFDRFASGEVSRLRVVTFAEEEKALDAQITVRSNGLYAGYCCRVVGNELWFSYGNGILIINPGAWARDTTPPPVVVEAVRVDGRNIPMDPASLRDLRLPPSHSRLDFEFAALSFDAPENNQYRYMLEGYDKQWNEAGTSRQATYTRLTAGDYRFRVIACNSDGVWNEAGAGVSFTVTPFYWQTWWFQLGVLAVVSLCVTVIVRFVSYRRLRWQLRLSEQEAAFHKERTRIARDMHDELGASLTQIALTSKLLKLDPPDSVSAHSDEIATIARRTVESLDEIVWAVDPTNDTLSSLFEYVGQFAVDFLAAAAIECEVDIPEDLPPHPLSSQTRHHLFLSVREALNNVVKHAGATAAQLSVVAERDVLRVTIEDNGCGFEPGNGRAGSDGLRNLRGRMAEIAGGCRIESILGEGTRVVFQLPLPVDGIKAYERALP